ncbi:MAG: TRAP transporter substrate-binding protein [Betaproteobacteria bacterium]|nr:TRAP transporter substrate-binding protein [Betaproteobacteria bacterium]
MRASIRFTRAAFASVGILAAGLAAAQDPKVKFNVANNFPNSLPIVGEAGPRYAERVKRASGGSIEMKFHEPGALVPALQSIQAASKGSVDAAWSSAGFFAGTDSAFNMFSTVPFGPTIPEYMAWMYYGGGGELQQEMFHKHGIHPLSCGIHAPEASGWFRKEIKSINDLKGLKMRFFGFGAKVMERLGVSTQLLAPGDIFQALQLGTIDATEFSMPALDQRQGFHQVAKYYYFPGWHQQASIVHLLINKAKWDALADAQKAVLELACGDMMRDVAAHSEAVQWKAMQEMRNKNGVKLMRWSPEILKAYEKAWGEVVAEESAKNPNFKKVWDSYSQFRANYSLWREYGYLKN